MKRKTLSILFMFCLFFSIVGCSLSESVYTEEKIILEEHEKKMSEDYNDKNINKSTESIHEKSKEKTIEKNTKSVEKTKEN